MRASGLRPEFPDLAAVCRALRPTAAAVGLFRWSMSGARKSRSRAGIALASRGPTSWRGNPMRKERGRHQRCAVVHRRADVYNAPVEGPMYFACHCSCGALLAGIAGGTTAPAREPRPPRRRSPTSAPRRSCSPGQRLSAGRTCSVRVGPRAHAWAARLGVWASIECRPVACDTCGSGKEAA